MRKMITACDRCETCIENATWNVHLPDSPLLELCYGCFAHYQDYMDRGGKWQDYIFNELYQPKEGGVGGAPVPVGELEDIPKTHTVAGGEMPICFHE